MPSDANCAARERLALSAMDCQEGLRDDSSRATARFVETIVTLFELDSSTMPLLGVEICVTLYFENKGE